MSKKPKRRLVMGETCVIEPIVPPNDADHIHGIAWRAERQGTTYSLSCLHGGHGGGERTLAISESDFETLRRDPARLHTIIIRNGG